MSYADPAWRAEKIGWRFRRSGQDGEATRVFDAFSPEVQTRLTGLAELRRDEVPAVATYRDESVWMLVTSDRVIWPEEGSVASMPLTEVKDATVLPRDLLAAGGKGKVEKVTLVTLNDRQVPVRVEAGRPLSGVWNAMKMVANWNRSPPA
ncbi:MAG: hypothetical protein AAFV53_18650 [Myxococcota bacterium]